VRITGQPPKGCSAVPALGASNAGARGTKSVRDNGNSLRQNPTSQQKKKPTIMKNLSAENDPFLGSQTLGTLLLKMTFRKSFKQEQGKI